MYLIINLEKRFNSNSFFVFNILLVYVINAKRFLFHHMIANKYDYVLDYCR